MLIKVLYKIKDQNKKFQLMMIISTCKLSHWLDRNHAQFISQHYHPLWRTHNIVVENNDYFAIR